MYIFMLKLLNVPLCRRKSFKVHLILFKLLEEDKIFFFIFNTQSHVFPSFSGLSAACQNPLVNTYNCLKPNVIFLIKKSSILWNFIQIWGLFRRICSITVDVRQLKRLNLESSDLTELTFRQVSKSAYTWRFYLVADAFVNGIPLHWTGWYQI